MNAACAHLCPFGPDQPAKAAANTNGGTVLGTSNRGNPFACKATENCQQLIHDYSSQCMDNARRLGGDAMMVIGGDGTQYLAAKAYTLWVSQKPSIMIWTRWK